MPMELHNCTAGFAQLDITPPLGVRLAGYFETRIADGVLDPLYVRAVAFGQGDKTALLLVCDLVNIRGGAAFAWPAMVAEQLGLPGKAVFLTHTHTHTGPEVGNDRGDERYDAWLLRRLCDAGRLAMDDRRTVTDVRTAQTGTSGLTFTRRFRAKDGHVQTWATDRENLVGPANEPDETLRLVRILRGDEPEIDLVNFQTHPDMIGGCRISADFPGALCRTVERERDNVRCIFLQGAEGELVPRNMLEGGGVKKGTPEAYARCMGHGERIARAALAVYDRAVPTGAAGVGFAQSVVLVKTKRDSSRVAEAMRVLEQIEAGRGEEVTHKWNITPLRAESQVLIMLDRDGIHEKELPVTVLTFCGVALVGVPGELFSQAGVRIRQASPFAATCVCSLTNGRVGYFATAEAYDQGGYEPSNCWLVKGVAEQLQETAIDLLNAL